ncbi:hypothetical protein [Chitinophaga sp. CB10]|uniref:hypothetical protein n=1 Tax=Chitinophaga sp. CB10 TaxID=1891659 RepID=UPI0025BD1A2E|nr:hypothetical protein [Chitinophaga sp. CB10]
MELQAAINRSYQEFLRNERRIQENLKSIDEYCLELSRDLRKAKKILVDAGILRPNGKPTWHFRHLDFSGYEDL